MSPRLRVIYLPLQAKQRFFTNGKQNRIEQAVKPGVPQQLPVQLLSVAQRQQPPLPQPNLPASALPSLQPQELSPLLKTENEENALSNRGNNNKSNLNQQQVLLSSRKQPYQVCVVTGQNAQLFTQPWSTDARRLLATVKWYKSVLKRKGFTSYQEKDNNLNLNPIHT